MTWWKPGSRVRGMPSSLGVEGGGDPLEPEDPDLRGEVGVEAVDEARRVDVEPAGDDLAGGADALIGAGSAGPVVAPGNPPVRLGNAAGEEEGLLEVAFYGPRAGILLPSGG